MSFNISLCFSSSGRKEDGGGGLAFDNEDEKDQWEEDQKVSGTFLFILFLMEAATVF